MIGTSFPMGKGSIAATGARTYAAPTAYASPTSSATYATIAPAPMMSAPVMAAPIPTTQRNASAPRMFAPAMSETIAPTPMSAPMMAAPMPTRPRAASKTRRAPSLSRPTMPRAAPPVQSQANLLAAGCLISERVVQRDECLATGLVRIEGSRIPPQGTKCVLSVEVGNTVRKDFFKETKQWTEKDPIISYVNDSRGKICYCTDVEGHWPYFVNFVRTCSAVKFTKKDSEAKEKDMMKASMDDLELELKDGWYFVFGGDSCDKGPGTIRFVTCMNKFKEKYPDRVFLLLGNRDINKMRWTSELHENAMNLDAPAPYYGSTVTPRQYLIKTVAGAQKIEETDVTDDMLKLYNTKAYRMRFMLKHEMGSDGEFEFRRQELAELRGAAVSDDEVMQSYTESVAPDGFMCRYLKLAQLGVRIGESLFVHGQIIGNDFRGREPGTWSIGTVPGETHLFSKVDVWLEKLNKWSKDQIAEWGARPTFEPYPTTSTREDWSRRGGYRILDYGSPAAEDPSVVYCRYLSEKSMPIQYPQRLVEHLVLNGISRVVVGHTPHGCAPTIVQHIGLTLVMGDTSFSGFKSDTAFIGDNRGDAVATIEIEGSHTHVEGHVMLQDDGAGGTHKRIIDYNVAPLGVKPQVHVDSLVGRSDGRISKDFEHDKNFFVKAKLPKVPGQDHDEYLLCQVDGFKVEYKQETKDTVEKFTADHIDPINFGFGIPVDSMAGAVPLSMSAMSFTSPADSEGTPSKELSSRFHVAHFHPEHHHDHHEFSKSIASSLYRMIDTHGDGAVKKDDFVNVCSKKIVRDGLMFAFPDQDIDTIFRKLDTDPDGKITEQEFKQVFDDEMATIKFRKKT